MSERKNPSTSIEAYKSLDPNQVRGIYKLIIYSLSVLGEATFEEIAAHMKTDKSVVWKRLSEMHRMEIIYRPGNKRVLRSGRKGYTWMLTGSVVPRTNEQALAYKKGTLNAADFAGQILSNSVTVSNPVSERNGFWDSTQKSAESNFRDY